MKSTFFNSKLQHAALLFIFIASCNTKNSGPSADIINEINLKRGAVISCGPANQQFGLVTFDLACNKKLKKDFDLAIGLLHSFEYDEAEKVFARIIDVDPGCAMSYWGVAMSNYHPLWAPPTEEELKKGAKAVEIAQSISQKSKRETEYINAIAAFYTNWKTTDHRSRAIRFEKEMEKIYKAYPEDKEAAIFYALSLDASADPADKSYSNQIKAGNILNTLYPGEPNHPGIVHYIIHTYDYPELASKALPAARKYASIAPSSAHALHMPSHIFTRLGLWDEGIKSNLVSVSSAKCYAEAAGLKGHWDEELHGLDYLMYAYLQKGDNISAKKQWDYLNSINEVTPTNFKVAYAFAAIPSRYVLENRLWDEAANLNLYPANLQWNKFPWQKAIYNFARLMGAVHIHKIAEAKTELANLNTIHAELVKQKDDYKANQVLIQIKTGDAWIQFKSGNNAVAIKLMELAAELEDKTGKHPVTPGEILPARELLADMLMEMGNPEKALAEYEAVLKTHPNRFNALYGAGLSAQKTSSKENAKMYYQQLLTVVNSTSSQRTELKGIKLFLQKS